MAHGITKKDSMMSVHETPWHRLGVVLKRRPKSIDEALRRSGLNWQVVQKPVYLRGGKLLDGFKANVHGKTGDVLAVVSDSYRVVQNLEAFQFLANLIGSELEFETAGSLFGGKAVWVLARIPEHIAVGGDATARYVLITLRHDGTGGVKVKVTPVRVVCNNTLSWALAGRSASYTVRHLGSPSEQLADARAVLGMTVDYYKQFARFGNKLASQKCSERTLRKVLHELYPGETGLGDRALKNREQAREKITQLFLGGKTVGNAPGTKWSALNAIVEYDQHYRTSRTDQGRFVRATEDPDGIQAKALALVTN